MAIATGGQYSQGGPSGAICDVRVDGVAQALTTAPGETADDTDAGHTNGFSRTVVAPSLPGSQPLPAGQHSVNLLCSELDGDAAIRAPTIAAIAIPGG
jgi:hypothetical protein